MVVFDIDGTLSIVGDRLKYLKAKDWDSFYECCGEDKPNKDIVHLCRQLMYFNEIVFVTGRRESVRGITLQWLQENVNPFIKDSQLYMRPNGDCRHDTIVKPELVRSFKKDIEMVYEDRDSMVKAWRDLGITTLQVAEGSF